MKYMLLIYTDESGWERMSEAERAASMPAWFEYTQALRDAGVMISGDALLPTATAQTVRPGDGGTRMVTDGPFAETKEALGGYYLIDVASAAEAVEWATRCPGSAYGSVEVRALAEFEMPEAP